MPTLAFSTAVSGATILKKTQGMPKALVVLGYKILKPTNR